MRLLLVLCLMFSAPVLSGAQTDSTAIQPDDRIMFQSKVRQLTSYLKEGNESAANSIFKDVSKDMERYINATQAAMDTAQGTEKKQLKNKLDNQRQLMARFQSFKPDLMRNRSSVETWIDQFIKTLYP